MGIFADCGCGCDGKRQEKRLLISVMSALLFYIIANPETFKLVRRIFGGWVSSPTGCPTMKGLVLHALVFLLITWALMNVKKEFADGAVDADAATPAPAAEAPPAPGADATPQVPDPVEDDDMASIMSPVPAPAPVPPPRPSKDNVSVCNCDDGSEILKLM